MLANRSHTKELLDRDDIPFPDIKKNMEELEIINNKLGGHRITVEGLRSFISNNQTGEAYHVAEIGCGGGDNLRAVRRWCLKNNIRISLTGVDINPHCIAFAREQAENEGISFICSDYKEVKFDNTPHIIFSSLFCHHFGDAELVSMLRWKKENSLSGFFINDLHRHPLAYYSIRTLTKLFSKSYLVKNDAPLSVARGFKKKDWSDLFQQAGISKYECEWRWAFRWLLTYKHHGDGK